MPCDDNSPADRSLANVSFRRRSYRSSINSTNLKRLRVKEPEDSSSSDEPDEQRSSDLPDLNPSISNQGSNSLAHTNSSQQLTPSELLKYPNLSQPPLEEDKTRSDSQPKSLLQKTLIKIAVDKQLANQSNQPDSTGVSGFSCSENDNDDDRQLTNREDTVGDESSESSLASAKVVEDEGFDSKSSSIGSVQEPFCMLSENQPVEGNPQSHPLCQTPQSIRRGKKLATSNPPSDPGLDPLPSLPNCLLDRRLQSNCMRSASPSAKLLENYEKEKHGGGLPPSQTVDFPLKSSFRKLSYTPEELLAFSLNRFEASDNSNTNSVNAQSGKPIPASLIRSNTQLNSRSPSFPVDESESFSLSEKRRLRSSMNGPSTWTPSPPKRLNIPTVPLSEGSLRFPHRIIRTPRSFLIKRRGSLTPLSASTLGKIDLEVIERLEDDEEAQKVEDGDTDKTTGNKTQEFFGGKRKVKFDRDVFCLEFDQLPEELSSSRLKRTKIDDDLVEEPIEET
ncbi:expressed protein [Phakopsora pachyrhizi]|uniref:Expressed protein n=1 Tax=Phakopsora pachyrhizi TaxID=170000 RepID=A0AAV0BLB6_PHAPC|nr:expressed protein [Phakopsora pachyrhizi]